ncbi:uncharacterized protein LOC119072971 [Bradysia coprophila]|uniref:uncharacterized protein LOC119072971 n=1 Tax=Bradysia coprophila TaxID=38358 RepID=UPI00187D6F40|nr:uncharacterized protein LOC119072971 [Bradysia coprophila]
MAPNDPYLREYADGVREIEVTINLMMARAKQTSSSLYMTFVELDDPYYNIAHSAVLEAIRQIPSAPIIRQFVMCAQEFRRPGRGIMDGIECELSRLVLGVCMNPVLKAIDQSKGFPISAKENLACKAFVEKLVIMAKTEEDMKEHLDKVGDALKAIGLEKIDAGRCRYVAMTFDNNQMSVKNDLDFQLADQKIRGVQKRESWQFLGKKFQVK